MLVAVGMVVLWPRGDLPPGANRVGLAGTAYGAIVEDFRREPCTESTEPQDTALCYSVTARLLEGPDRGETTELFFPDSPTTPILSIDERIVLAYQEESADPEFRYAFVDRERGRPLFWLALVFAAAVVLLGRLRGLAALVGLALSIVVLLAFMLPAIVHGRDPVLVAIVGSSAVAYLALYLAHGFKPMTTVALLGTLSSLALTALLASAFVGLTKLSGLASEESIIIRLFSTQVDATGLVLAGIVIGALGALDDVTVTQASAVWELRDANPGMTRRDLYRSGLRIGRDHVASTVNTLLLAYAGASLPLLLFFVLSEQSVISVANQEVVATEIVRTLVGSVGLVVSVPLTTWLAARVAASARAR